MWVSTLHPTACQNATSDYTDYLSFHELSCIVNLRFQVATQQPSINLAVSRTTWQVKTYDTWESSRAVDGKPDPTTDGGSCARTTAISNPWWAVDLEAIYELHRVHVVALDTQREWRHQGLDWIWGWRLTWASFHQEDAVLSVKGFPL